MSDILLLGAGRGGYSAGGGGGGGGGEVTYQVNAGGNDGHFITPFNQGSSFPSTFSSFSNSATVVNALRNFDSDDNPAYSYRKAFHRFENIEIAQGTTIQSAFLKVFFTAGGGTVNVKIVATDLDNVSAPSAASPDGDTSRHTSAVVSWSNPSISASTRQTSPDIKTLIQEVVDRSGWSSGNAIMIQLYIDDTGTNNKQRSGPSYEDDSAKTAQLVITT